MTRNKYTSSNNRFDVILDHKEMALILARHEFLSGVTQRQLRALLQQ